LRGVAVIPWHGEKRSSRIPVPLALEWATGRCQAQAYVVGGARLSVFRAAAFAGTWRGGRIPNRGSATWVCWPLPVAFNKFSGSTSSLSLDTGAKPRARLYQGGQGQAAWALLSWKV